jgi:hypothetical protein
MVHTASLRLFRKLIIHPETRADRERAASKWDELIQDTNMIILEPQPSQEPGTIEELLLGASPWRGSEDDQPYLTLAA